MSLNLAISARGMAEPPTQVRFMDEKRRPLASTCWIGPIQMVGTPALMVTCSASISSYKLAPSSLGPGSTSFAPATMAAYGMHQALLWNMGTTGSAASRAERLSTSGRHAVVALSTMARCEYSTPLGLPVVPEV